MEINNDKIMRNKLRVQANMRKYYLDHRNEHIEKVKKYNELHKDHLTECANIKRSAKIEDKTHYYYKHRDVLLAKAKVKRNKLKENKDVEIEER